MKKIVKALSVILAPIVMFFIMITGCKGQDVDIDNTGIMRDINKEPEQDAAYEQYSKQALENYKSVAAAHTDPSGSPDLTNAEVQKAACETAAKLYAYACYNERTLDKYAYFSNQTGDTDVGGSGYAKAVKQEYYLRVNESETTCGLRYHYTLKKVQESSGLISMFGGLFESARLRITDKTNLLYRFEGDTKSLEFGEEDELLGCRILKCNWSTGGDWGKPDVEMKKGEFIPPESIEEDIVNSAGEDNITIRGNINILAKDIVKSATIAEDDEGGILVVMSIDTAVANKDEASLKMLRRANSAGDCVWEDDGEDTGLLIVFRLWQNGLFRFYNIKERWHGTMQGFNSIADSVTSYFYSYSDRDCDMTENLKMLEAAKAEKG